MTRHLLTILLFLLLGAVANVAVAWGCGAWMQLGGGEYFYARLGGGDWWVSWQWDRAGAGPKAGPACERPRSRHSE